MKENQDFNIKRGEYRVLSITTVDKEASALSLDNYTVVWYVWRNKSRVVTKKTDNGIVVTDASAWSFEIELESADTNLPFGEYYHECRVIDSNNNEVVVFTGSMIVEGGQ